MMKLLEPRRRETGSWSQHPNPVLSKRANRYLKIWWFPNIVVPPAIIHFRWGISIKTNYWGCPIYGNPMKPPYMVILLMLQRVALSETPVALYHWPIPSWPGTKHQFSGCRWKILRPVVAQKGFPYWLVKIHNKLITRTPIIANQNHLPARSPYSSWPKPLKMMVKSCEVS